MTFLLCSQSMQYNIEADGLENEYFAANNINESTKKRTYVRNSQILSKIREVLDVRLNQVKIW